MKYYSNLKNGKPKIFGMTASPLSQGDLSVISVKKRLVELQKILDSTIVTVTNNLDTELCVSKIEERLVRFNSYVVHQGQIYEYLQDVKRELYLFAFASIDVNYRPNIGSMKDMHSQLKELIKNTQHKDTSSLEKQLHSLDTIMLDYGIFASYTSAEQLYKQVLGKSAKRKFDLSYTPLDFSPKLMALIDILKAHFDKPTPQKCIVFVEKRDHAESLCRMIRMISLEHDIKINSSFVVGRGSGRNFPETIIDFREGKINLLVSTNVCAEGLILTFI
jgi:ERCC4-related helicase